MGKMRSGNKQKGQRMEQATGLKGKLSKAEEAIFRVNTDNWGDAVQKRNFCLSCSGARLSQGVWWGHIEHFSLGLSIFLNKSSCQGRCQEPAGCNAVRQGGPTSARKQPSNMEADELWPGGQADTGPWVHRGSRCYL